MKIVNHTSIPDATLKEMARSLTKGITRKIGDIIFSYTRKRVFLGYCHLDKTPAIITVAFAKNETGYYPIKMNTCRHPQFNFPVYGINSEEEMCYDVLAHEIYHLRAHLNGRWKSTEKRAETFAFKRLQEWRGES